MKIDTNIIAHFVCLANSILTDFRNFHRELTVFFILFRMRAYANASYAQDQDTLSIRIRFRIGLRIALAFLHMLGIVWVCAWD